jgi:death-on-curing protein
MKYISAEGVLILHKKAIEMHGGDFGVRDIGLLESAVFQPQMTFGGQELYPDLVEKAAVLAFSLVKNHPFVDGNKRTGQMAMEAFLLINGFEISANVDEQEVIFLRLASSEITREELIEWIEKNIVGFPPGRESAK